MQLLISGVRRQTMNRTALSFVAFLLSFWEYSLAVITSVPSVSYNKRSFVINGKPTLLLSGSIHYNRIPPSDWDNVLKLAKELGLNCVQTYVFWSEHEPHRGQFNYREGYGNLERFLELVRSNDLYAVVRIGPYACGEYYFGGLPLWLRNVDNITCFRCSDPIWKREMKRFVGIVLGELDRFLLQRGGPIIALQIENEYPKDDDYLEWSVDTARQFTTDVPWILCHDVPQCIQLNQKSKSTAASNTDDTVLCSINGFWTDSGGGGNQPGPEFFELLSQSNDNVTNQPAMWTEDQGWFDLWGMAHRVRYTSDQLYGIARFFALGGSYHNLYMLAGGNNYGRRAGRYSTTAYAPDTVIDSFLLRHEPRFSIYRDFFRTIQGCSHDLLSHPLPKSTLNFTASTSIAPVNARGLLKPNEESKVEVHRYGNVVFLSNTGENSNTTGTVIYQNRSFYLPNHTVILLNVSSGAILANTSNVEEETKMEKATRRLNPRRIPFHDWKVWKDRIGYGAIRSEFASESPEQLNVTNNDSDYCWYTFYTKSYGPISINPIGYGGIQYSYVNGILSNYVPEPKPFEFVSLASDRSLQSDRVRSRIDILSVGMGLNNFGTQPTSGKGVHSVKVGDATETQFKTAWKIRGEELSIFTANGAKLVRWNSNMNSSLINQDLMWFQATFRVPGDMIQHVGGPQPNQTALVLNLSGLSKGVVYVNGFNLGRYWLLPGQCEGQCAPPHHGSHCYLHWKHCGKPTQWLYHIPFEILLPKQNVVTMFEETLPMRPRNIRNVFIEVLHDHPY